MTAPATLPVWAPSPNDVGAVIARLIPDSSGRLTGFFGPDTLPTATQVGALAVGVVAEVALAVPGIPEVAFPVARRVAALGTAVQAVNAYFPEARQEYVDRLAAQYDAALARLLTGVASLEVQETDVDDVIQAFPVAWDSRPPELTERVAWI